jgi:Ferritin-like
MNELSEWTIGKLEEHLQGAVELEMLTIPPYLTAWYSLHPGTNKKAAEIIKSVVIEEMLHLALASNVFNAIGGHPKLTEEGGYVPRYPAKMPFHIPKTFEVGLGPFSDVALEVFLTIENPTHPEVEPPQASPEAAIPRVLEFAEKYGYKTIGAFYEAIEEGLKELDAKGGLFKGDPARQIGPEYYSGGGRVIIVTGLETAREALQEIVEQGEGDVTAPLHEEMFDPEGELAHFYRFKELHVGRLYRPGDTPDEPTGEPIELDFEAVYPMKPNLRAETLTGELRERAEAFNHLYSGLLGEIQKGINGTPEALENAIGVMFKLKKAAKELLPIPLPDGSGFNAGPTFEYEASGKGG